MMAKTKKKTKKKNPLCERGMRAQSVLFHKDHWDKATSRQWLRDHAFKIPLAVAEGNYLRYRQEPIGHFDPGSFRTKTIDFRRGVRLIVGCPKTDRPSKRRRIDNPAPEVPGTVVYLGEAVEIALRDESVLKLRGYALCANPDGTRLYALRKINKQAVSPATGKIAEQARSLFEAFTDFAADRDFALRISTGKLVELGEADHIVYKSDKWTGKKTEYIHEFTKRPTVWANANKSVIAIVGAIRVRKEGITG